MRQVPLPSRRGPTDSRDGYLMMVIWKVPCSFTVPELLVTVAVNVTGPSLSARNVQATVAVLAAGTDCVALEPL